MAEYISKQDVIDYLNGYLNSIGECGADSLLFDRGQRRALINSIQDILAAKAADVQPVKRGEWKTNSEFYPYCSECGAEAVLLVKCLSNYCPHCGARMDGDAE